MNLLENTKREEMVNDGWVVTATKDEEHTKWVLLNEKYNYRDFLVRYKIHWDAGINELLRNLKIKKEMNLIKLPYDVKINMGMEGRKKNG